MADKDPKKPQPLTPKVDKWSSVEGVINPTAPRAPSSEERKVTDERSAFEVQNEGGSGARSVGTGADMDRSRGRSAAAGGAGMNFRRGLFALMASFDWDRGEFSEQGRDPMLRQEGMELLGLPPHLSSQFNKEGLETFMQSMQQTGLHKRDFVDQQESQEQVRRSTDYIRNLIKLSQTLSKNRRNRG